MLTIYVSPGEMSGTTVDGLHVTVKIMQVRDTRGFIDLHDWEPLTEPQDVEIVLMRRFYLKRLELAHNVKDAILYFLKGYHARQDITFDCYAFANLVRGVEVHRVPCMMKYWSRRPLPWFLSVGSVVFLESGENQFHHAAVYLGQGLYISVWGAGGDLEIATLKSMKRDYGAERVVLAQPK
jgi:hypothetical protein